MRGRTLVALFVSGIAITCGANPKARTSSAPLALSKERPPRPRPDRAAFDEAVKPLLARTCTPCHVPGGRMYATLPFDDPETVASHAEGILKRLKEPDDKRSIEDWLKARTGRGQ